MSVTFEQHQDLIVDDESDNIHSDNPYYFVGKVVARKYRIIKILSLGGMGIVYYATQLSTNQRVALKILLPCVDNSDPSARDRFALEIKLLAEMHHPNIVSLLDSGFTENGCPFLVTKFISGVPLTVFLDEKSLSLQNAIEIWIQISSALGFAHSRNIFHRDIKSDNVIVSCFPNNSLHCTLIDFGVAKDAHLQSTLTQPGMAPGTLAGIAPEILAGSEASPRSDLFSLGILIFQMLTGHYPCDTFNPLKRLEFYESTFADDIRLQLSKDLPELLIQLVSRLLSFEEANRPSCAYDVQKQLEQLLFTLDSLQRSRTLVSFYTKDGADTRPTRAAFADTEVLPSCPLHESNTLQTSDDCAHLNLRPRTCNELDLTNNFEDPELKMKARTAANILVFVVLILSILSFIMAFRLFSFAKS